MAKKALSYKVKADNDVASYQQMYETITTQTDAIRNQVETLKAKLEEADGKDPEESGTVYGRYQYFQFYG